MKAKNTGKSAVGRKKIYASSAERQHAYRERVKKNKNVGEIRLVVSAAGKKRLQRIAQHESLTIAEVIEKLLKEKENAILKGIARNDESLCDYML